MKTGGQFYRFVAVRHPDGKSGGEAFKKTRAVLDLNVGVTVLALVRGPHFAAQGVHHELQPVADTKNRQAQLEHTRVGGRRISVIHR